ncbi:Ldh family oxidoreductase [Nordella sp. HKS 07]|uniref:Ldh family oxidoreductase n=1 Tax=Nordella sp. HKS 07 TaxID=2712222 RepID=UPI0013E134EF|nr:Ldh family oxidoreductase [Nordella sp. HKS 07]QIG51378.1 Ldh family oxidoreductase [Nordella sp. HKS 07]
MTERRATAEKLAAFSYEVLTSAGADPDSAEATTGAMLHASLLGVDSHGIRLLPFYADCLRGGICKPKPVITIAHPRRSAVLVDADDGLGHLPTYRAMDEACAIARDTGIGMGVVINSTHFGAAGAYALAAAQAGFIGFVTCNSGAFVVPHGGKKPLHGTSPIAMAAPLEGREPYFLDMATSSIPWNKVMRYRTEGLELPPDVALDADGNYTADPHAAICLGPVGGAGFGYKGAGLAGLAEVLGAMLTGMRLSIEQSGIVLGDTKVGHFVMAIDPSTFVPAAVFAERHASYLDGFKAEPGILPAGGPEWARRIDREAKGIPLPDGLYQELAEAAEKAKVALTL